MAEQKKYLDLSGLTLYNQRNQQWVREQIAQIPVPEVDTPDWSENDETSGSYIQNRPFYSENTSDTEFLLSFTLDTSKVTGTDLYTANWLHDIDDTWEEGDIFLDRTKNLYFYKSTDEADSPLFTRMEFYDMLDPNSELFEKKAKVVFDGQEYSGKWFSQSTEVDGVTAPSYWYFGGIPSGWGPSEFLDNYDEYASSGETDFPFVIWFEVRRDWAAGQLQIGANFLGEGVHTVDISSLEETELVHKLDNKYLDIESVPDEEILSLFSAEETQTEP